MESNEFFYEKCDCCGSEHRSDRECKGCLEMEAEESWAEDLEMTELMIRCQQVEGYGKSDDQDELPF